MNTPTKISSDKLRAAQLPPTEIVEKPGIEPAVVVDPAKLVKAWSASTDVMREVVSVVEAARADMLHGRQSMEQLLKTHLLVGSVVVISTLASILVEFL
jgi:hypothetical protein